MLLFNKLQEHLYSECLYFNTSNVTIQLGIPRSAEYSALDFNTSNVTIQPNGSKLVTFPL